MDATERSLYITEVFHNWQNFYNSALLECRVYKSLGIYLDEFLTFDQHVMIVSKKLSNACYMLSRVKNILPKCPDILTPLQNRVVRKKVRKYSLIAAQSRERYQSGQSKRACGS